jgi:hypothetical protein
MGVWTVISQNLAGLALVPSSEARRAQIMRLDGSKKKEKKKKIKSFN